MNEQKVIAITGASSGIGEGLARLFSQRKFTVVLMARKLEAMRKLQLANTFCYELDVTNHQKVKECVEDVEEKIGPVDFWVNNAGVGFDGEFSSISHQHNNDMVQVNLAGVINCTQAVLPRMQQRRSGTIINISSLADRALRPNLAVYAATKAAVTSFSQSLRVANAKYGIRVCNVSPGKVETPLVKSLSLQQSTLISVDDFAEIIFWIASQPKDICIRDIVVAPTNYEG